MAMRGGGGSEVGTLVCGVVIDTARPVLMMPVMCSIAGVVSEPFMARMDA